MTLLKTPPPNELVTGSAMSSSGGGIAGLVRPVGWAADQMLPLVPELEGLFPRGGLRRGSTVVIGGSTSLALATMAAASAGGSWCAAVGMPSLGVAAAAEMGMRLERFALIPRPGDRWPLVAAALLDAFDIVLVCPTSPVRSADAHRLSGRARDRRAVIVPFVDDPAVWPGADVRVQGEGVAWQGLGQGHGHLTRRSIRVSVCGRGAASREHHQTVSLMAS